MVHYICAIHTILNVHYKWLNCMACELYVSKAVIHKNKSKDKWKAEKQVLSHSFSVLLGLEYTHKI